MEIEVKITGFNDSVNLYVKYHVKIIDDLTGKHEWDGETCVDDTPNEEALKKKIMEKIEEKLKDLRMRKLMDDLKGKTWKNEDFTFSKIFGVKK